MKYSSAETRQAALRGHEDDVRQAEKRVAETAIRYVAYFFPPTETGEGLDNESGALIRAVRALDRARKRPV